MKTKEKYYDHKINRIFVIKLSLLYFFIKQIYQEKDVKLLSIKVPKYYMEQ